MQSLINKIYQFLLKQPEVIHPDPDFSSDLQNVPRWPPFDNGLPNIPIDQILRTQADLISNIKKSLRNDLVDQAINNFVRYVHLLPATKDQNHRGAGGLFRMGLEVAFYSVRASEGRIFTAAETPDVRQLTEPKWRFAAFLAGLCCDTYRVMSGMVITSSDGHRWPALNIPLAEWLEKNNYDRYYLRWVPNASLSSHQAQTMSSYVASQIIPIQATQEIATDFNEIALALMATINGSGLDHPNPLTTIVQDVRMRVIQKDLGADNSSFGKAIVGTHLEPYILTAMRKLVTNGVWKINEKGARLWVDKTGSVYLIWKTAFTEILHNLDTQTIKGVPNDMHVLSDMMVKSEAFTPDTAKNSAYWMVYPPTAKEPYPAVRIASMDVIFDLDTQKAIKPVDYDMRRPSPEVIDAQKAAQKVSNKVTNTPATEANNVGNNSQAKTQHKQPVIDTQPVQQEIQLLDTEPAENIAESHANLDLLYDQFPPASSDDMEPFVDISSHLTYGDDSQPIPAYEEPPYIDPDMDALIPSSAQEPQLSPLQKIELQKLDKKTSDFLESVVLSHQLSKIDSKHKPVGFIYKYAGGNKNNSLLYAIPLSHADALKLDRLVITQQLHKNDFAWIEPGQTRKVESLTVPQLNKKEMCVILNSKTSKLFELVT